MKISTTLLLSSVCLLAACVPPEDVPTPTAIAPVLDRFDTTSYAADTSNDEDLQGLWMMTTKNYIDSASTSNSRTGDTANTETQGSFRMACSIVLVDGEYNSSCYGAGSLSVTDGVITNNGGTWLANVTDNTHITGSYYSTYSVNNNFNGISSTTTTAMEFDMVKINSANTVISNMTLTSNDVSESVDIIEFYETAFTETAIENDNIVSSDVVALFNAFGDTGSLFGLYSQLNGASMLANTSNLSIVSDSAEISISANTALNISLVISGDDNDGVPFTASLDLTL